MRENLSLSIYQWMTHISMTGFTRNHEKKGKWPGFSTTEVVNDLIPPKLPILPNRKWGIWNNHPFIAVANLRLPDFTY